MLWWNLKTSMTLYSQIPLPFSIYASLETVYSVQLKKLYKWIQNYFDIFLTVHHSIELFHLPTLMHNSLFINNMYSYTTILDMFRALTCPSSGGPTVFSQHLVTSLSVNGCTVHRLRADWPPLSTGVLYSRLQRATLPDATRIQLGTLMLETCRG